MKTRLDIIEIEDLPTELIRKRNQHKITQKMLADKLESSKSCISAIENSKRKVSIYQYAKIFSEMGYKIQIAITEEKL